MKADKKDFRRFLKRHLFSAVFFLALSPVYAAIAPTVNYQGFLVSKATNLAVDSPQAIVFKLYNAAVGGTALFTESRCGVPVSKGRYDVEIGSTTAGGIDPAVFQNNQNVWLEIQVDPDADCAAPYETMQPRIKLQASPYAFNSLYASTASAATTVFRADTFEAFPATTNGAITISTNLYVMGGISVGNISPGQKLSVAGIVESKDPGGGFMFPDGSVQLKAAANTLWDAFGDNVYSVNAGNIGISTGNPLARLHVYTPAPETGSVLRVTVGPTDVFDVSGEGFVNAAYYFGDGSTMSGVVKKAGDIMTGPLTITSSISVTSVMGVSSPRYKLFPNVEISSTTSLNYGGVYISTNVYLPAGARYYGDGGGLSNIITVDPLKVALAGDTMTGQLTIKSTLTVTGGAFSVGGSTLSVLAGNVAVGNSGYLSRFTVGGGILATSSITAQGGFFSSFADLTQYVMASSGTFWATGQYSLETSSGIKVNAGTVTAPLFVGNGSQLTSVTGTDSTKLLKGGDTMTGGLRMSGSSITIINASASESYSLTVASAQNVSAYGLAVTTANRVGIQVLLPTAPLEVYKQIVVSNIPGAGGDASLYLHANGGNMTYLRWAEDALFGTGGVEQGALGFPVNSRHLVYRAGASNPDGAGGGQEVFRISAGAVGADWKFGIGTSLANPPLEKFHVAANVLIGTSAVNPTLYISTVTNTVSVNTKAAAHKVTIDGDLLVVSSITANKFYGDGSGITGISAGGLPAMIEVSSIAAKTGSAYNAVVFTSNTYISTMAVGEIFTPQSPLHLRGAMTIDQKESEGFTALNFNLHNGGPAYITWSESVKTNKGSLGMPSNLRDLVFLINTGNEEVFRVKGNSSGGSGWQFGIGTSNPLAPFHVATNLLVSTAAASPLLFVSTTTGSVGISTSAPSERFHVASNMLVSTAAASPIFYVSTGTGRVGIGTKTPRAPLEVGDGNMLAAGSYTGAPSLPVTGAGTRFMWLPSMSAIRAGTATGAQWDTVGSYSAAFGADNQATGNYSMAVGSTNIVSGNYGAAAGSSNTVSGNYSVVGGGSNNTASGDHSTVSGGEQALSVAQYAAVGGGFNNMALAYAATVSGGKNNIAGGEGAMVAGGDQNKVYAAYSTSGGRLNVVHSTYSWVGGYRNSLLSGSDYTFVWGASTTTVQDITVPYGFIIDPGNDGIKVGIGNKDPQAKLDVTGSAQFGAGGTTSTFTAEGYWQPRWMNSADIQNAAPGVIGAVIGNSDIMDLCISTGAAQGNWALVGSKGALGCYP